MELRAATADAYLRHALTQLLGVADRLGEPSINVRPLGPATSSVASLVVHCCGVADFWLGHVALGEPSTRDRGSEFSRTASLTELHDAVDATLDRVATYLARLDAGEGTEEAGRQVLRDGDTSDASVVLHVIEELFQHLGHAELTADALADRPERP